MSNIHISSYKELVHIHVQILGSVLMSMETKPFMNRSKRLQGIEWSGVALPYLSNFNKAQIRVSLSKFEEDLYIYKAQTTYRKQ